MEIRKQEARRAIVLAEYAALRSEITTLLSLQGQFLSFSIVFFGFVVTMSNRDSGMPAEYLPLLPIPFSVLGLLYADLAFRIMRAARYIHDELRPILNVLSDAECFGWEMYIRSGDPHRGLLAVMDRLRWCFFLVPSIAFWAIGRPHTPPWPVSWMWVAWTLGFALIAALIAAMFLARRLSRQVTDP